MEQEILQTARRAIGDAIVSELTGYNKPLSKLTAKVIEANEVALYALINDEFSALLSSEEFRAALKDALNAKLAKTLIARMGGELEKRVNELKQNPTTRAKITLAIESALDG